MKKYADNRPSRHERGYTNKWVAARNAYIKQHPLCVMCEQLGITKAATVVDHIKPHKGDNALFWDKNNWQSLCKHCHDSVKQAYELSGFYKGASKDGLPLDAGHWWR